MDAFTNLAGYASPDFASTTGVTMQQIGNYATSSVMQVFIGSTLDFIKQNAPEIIAYTMIGLVLLLVVRVFIFWQFY